MILIRDRDELLRHVDNLATMAEAEVRKTGAGSALHFARGRLFGLRQAVQAIEAWPQSGRPLVDVLADDIRPCLMCGRPTPGEDNQGRPRCSDCMND